MFTLDPFRARRRRVRSSLTTPPTHCVFVVDNRCAAHGGRQIRDSGLCRAVIR